MGKGAKNLGGYKEVNRNLGNISYHDMLGSRTLHNKNFRKKKLEEIMHIWVTKIYKNIRRKPKVSY